MNLKFRHHVIDESLPPGCYAQTALADLDGDGRLEYVLGRQCGEICWYELNAPDGWSRRLLGTDSPSDVGACVIDVDGARSGPGPGVGRDAGVGDPLTKARLSDSKGQTLPWTRPR